MALMNSITTITRHIYNLISNHPMVANPKIYHPLTGEQIKIQRYRLYNGLNTQSGLTCSIAPFAGTADEQVPNPRTTSVSVMYDPYDLGNEGRDKAVYHISISLYYNEVAIGNVIVDEVPVDGLVSPDKILLTTPGKKSVNLEINPGIEIIGNYIELMRLVINDVDYRQYWPTDTKSLEVVYGTLSTGNWDDQKNVYFQSGVVMARLDAYPSRGWRDKFIQPLEDIHIRLN